MNPDDLVSAFTLAGFDTIEKVQALLTSLDIETQIAQIDAQLSSLGAKQAGANQPFNDQRTQLNNQRVVLVAQLNPNP